MQPPVREAPQLPPGTKEEPSTATSHRPELDWFPRRPVPYIREKGSVLREMSIGITTGKYLVKKKKLSDKFDKT